MNDRQQQSDNAEQQKDNQISFPTTQETVLQPNQSEEFDHRKVVDDVARRITKAAGVEHLEGFSINEMFSEVFKKHSDAEVEAYFTVGTTTTTPAIADIDTSWPKPWVFFRTFVGALVVYIGFVQAWQTFQNINLIPGLIIVGSFVVPFSTLIFFFETNVRRNVSLYQVIRLVFLGGVLSLISSLFLFQISYSLNLGWLGASVAGIVEEPGKLLALLLVVNMPKFRYTLNGLLFGAAIGTGFAAFESAGYALYAGLAADDPNAMLNVIQLRGMLAPFGHIVWTGMSAAVLWKIKGEQKFNFDMIRDNRFLRIFGIAVLLHMIWNSPIDFPFYGKYAALGFVAWIVILALIQDGLKQLRTEKLAAMAANEDLKES
jgi:protease PrsW